MAAEEEQHSSEIQEVKQELQTMMEKVRDEMWEAKSQHEAAVETYMQELQDAQSAMQAAGLMAEREITSLHADNDSLTSDK